MSKEPLRILVVANETVGGRALIDAVRKHAEQYATMNAFISVCSFIFGLSFLIFLYNMITSWRNGPKAAGNPWRAHSIEWQVSSPPPIFNFDEIPTVVSGPYEYGVPGAVHAVFKEEHVPAKATPAPAGGGGAPPPSE